MSIFERVCEYVCESVCDIYVRVCEYMCEGIRRQFKFREFKVKDEIIIIDES